MLSDKPWKPDAVVRLLMALFASMFLGAALSTWLRDRVFDGPGQAEWATLLIGTLSFHGMALVLTHFFVRAHETTWKEAFGLRSERPGRALGLAVLAGVAILPIVWSLGQVSAKVLQMFNVEPAVQEPVEMLQTSVSPALKAVIGICAVVIAPIGEEIVFRGILYPVIKQSGYPRMALWGTSLFFAIIHGKLMIFLPLTFLAVILTLLYETTDNLVAPIVTHSFFNFVNFFWLVAQPAVRG